MLSPPLFLRFRFSTTPRLLGPATAADSAVSNDDEDDPHETVEALGDAISVALPVLLLLALLALLAIFVPLS